MAAIVKNTDVNLSLEQKNVARLKEDKSILSFSPVTEYSGITLCTSTAYDGKGKKDKDGKSLELSGEYSWYDYDPKQVSLAMLLEFLETKEKIESAEAYVLEQFQGATKTKSRNAKALSLRQSRDEENDPVKRLLKQAKAFAPGSRQKDYFDEQMKRIMEQVDKMGVDSSEPVADTGEETEEQS